LPQFQWNFETIQLSTLPCAFSAAKTVESLAQEALLRLATLHNWRRESS
jgi:hypothetical protein